MNDEMTIGVLGGGTGAGATTALVALAMRADAAGRTVAVIDADASGGGVDVALGIETEPGVRWEDLLGSDGPLDGERLLERLPGRGDSLSVLSFGRQWCALPTDLLDRAVAALSEVRELVLIDLGRDPGVVAPGCCDDVLLVARGTPCGLAAAGATAQRMQRPPRLVVRGLRASRARLAAELLDLELMACLSDDRHLAGDSERGIPPGTRHRSSYVGECDRLLRDLLLPAEDAA